MGDPWPEGGRASIMVVGSGHVSRRPDQAELSLSVETTAGTASEAQRIAGEGMRKVLAAAGGFVEPADLATQSVSLDPVYDYRETGALLTGYRASQALAVRLRKLDDLGPLIDAAVAAGATGIGGVSMGLADRTDAEAEARSLAVEDARLRARGLAAAAGISLGPLLGLAEGTAVPPPRPMMRMAAEQMAATPIAEGSTEVAVEIRAWFAIEG